MGWGETYRREEVFEALSRHQGEMQETEYPGKGVLDGVSEAIPGATGNLLHTSVRAKDSVLRDLLFLGAQKTRVVRPVRQQRVGRERDHEGRDAFDEKEPLPGVEACDTSHCGEDSCGEEAGNDVRYGVSCVPDGHSERIFLFGVP